MPLLTTTRFPVVLVMTTSIPLHILAVTTALTIIANFPGLSSGKTIKTAKILAARAFSLIEGAKRRRGLRRASSLILFRSPEKDAQTLSMASRKSL